MPSQHCALSRQTHLLCFSSAHYGLFNPQDSLVWGCGPPGPCFGSASMHLSLLGCKPWSLGHGGGHCDQGCLLLQCSRPGAQTERESDLKSSATLFLSLTTYRCGLEEKCAQVWKQLGSQVARVDTLWSRHTHTEPSGPLTQLLTSRMYLSVHK